MDHDPTQAARIQIWVSRDIEGAGPEPSTLGAQLPALAAEGYGRIYQLYIIADLLEKGKVRFDAADGPVRLELAANEAMDRQGALATCADLLESAANLSPATADGAMAALEDVDGFATGTGNALRNRLGQITAYADAIAEEAHAHDPQAAALCRSIQDATAAVLSHINRTLESGRNLPAPHLVCDLTRHTVLLSDSLCRNAFALSAHLATAGSDRLADFANKLATSVGLLLDAALDNLPVLSQALAISPSTPMRPLSQAPVGHEEGNLLVVDDMEENREMLAFLFSRYNYAVRTASDGAGALAAVAESAPDLILLDITMPDMTGFDVLRRLKADPETAKIAVLMITGITRNEYTAQAIELGADAVVHKPFDPQLLRARVRSALEKKRARDKEVRFLQNLARLTQKVRRR